MMAYTARLRSAKRQLEVADPGTRFSDTIFAQRLLRSAGLSKMEQRQVLASAGASWDTDKIAAALRMVFDDCHHDDKSIHFLPSGPNTFKNNDKPHFRHFPASGGRDGKDGKGKGGYGKGYGKGKGGFKGKDGKPMAAYAAETADEDDEGDYEPEDTQDDCEDDEWTCQEDAECPELDDDEEWQEPPADVNYSGKGGGRGRDGKFKKKMGTPVKKGTCADCGLAGHWRGDPACEWVK